MSWDDTHAFLNMLRCLLAIHPLTVETHETGLRLSERYGMVLDEGLQIVNPFVGAR